MEQYRVAVLSTETGRHRLPPPQFCRDDRSSRCTRSAVRTRALPIGRPKADAGGGEFGHVNPLLLGFFCVTSGEKNLKDVSARLPVKLNMARYKCYVVWVGRRPGMYYTWSECYEQVNGYPGARYKGFVTVEEGNMAFRGIILRPTSSANDTVQIQAPSVVHETQPREAKERVVYRDVVLVILLMILLLLLLIFVGLIFIVMDFDALLREAILEKNAMSLAVGEMLMSSIIDEDEEDTTPIPRLMHTSRHTGHVWVHEVLQGHERRCYNTFRMHSSMFLKLRDILVERELIRDSRYVTTIEQLAMFLYAMGHGVATGAMCEHFQHSSETISFYVNRVIKAIALLRFTYIVLPIGTEPIHPRIRHDDRFYPYFKDAICAIDGTYIPAHVLKDRQARYRNRKNVISQNVMGVCGFDLIFHYVGVGFEGAAADMTVLR
ncbi:hypothetical protein Taro_037457 [Colocasia esculenta]|uniref:Uncharacterized protein n=1 Tax=Colocasia esculenta TaxID=4460 RepID=A0A843W480_COLES|nr:hypothetical protein [Colocasia esculenta]